MVGVAVEFVLRCLMVALFLPFSALDKIINFKAAIGQAASAIPSPALARLLIFAGLGVEVVMSLGVISGVADRLAGLILAVYCAVTALLWKRFWTTPDFRLGGASQGREVFWDFMKNLALAGGFLLLAVGPDASGARALWDHPLASSHPYAATP